MQMRTIIKRINDLNDPDQAVHLHLTISLALESVDWSLSGHWFMAVVLISIR